MTSRRLALLAAVFAAVGLIVLTVGTGQDHPTEVATPGPTATAPPSSARPADEPVAVASTTTNAPSSASTPPVSDTAPALRQRPQLYPDPGLDPRTVAVVQAPQGDPTPTELASPTAAAAAWASRWCPFTSTEALGAAEGRARPVMTPAGWASFDPQTDPVAVGAWAGVSAAGLRGACAAPDVGISPEAPSTDTAAYVTVTMTRVVTDGAGTSSVETVIDTRLVLLVDGRWLVDTPAPAG